MNAERIKEKLAYYRIYVTLLWTGIFILGGGINWAFVNYKDLFLVIPAIGTLIEISFIMGLIFLDRRMRKLFKEL